MGAVDVDDLPDPAAALAALEAAGFIVSLEQRPSAVTERADVVLPVAAVAEKAGTFPFYCNLQTEDGCRQMRGELVVKPRK